MSGSCTAVTGIQSTRPSSGNAHIGTCSERRRRSGTAKPSAGTIHTSAPKPRKYAIGMPSVSGMIGHAGSTSARASRRDADGTYRPIGASATNGSARAVTRRRSPDRRSARRCARSRRPRRRRGRSGERAGRVRARRARRSERGFVVGQRDEVAGRHEVGEGALVIVDVLAEARPARDDDRPQPGGASLHDGAGAAGADRGVGLGEERRELVGRQERSPLGLARAAPRCRTARRGAPAPAAPSGRSSR